MRKENGTPSFYLLVHRESRTLLRETRPRVFRVTAVRCAPAHLRSLAAFFFFLRFLDRGKPESAPRSRQRIHAFAAEAKIKMKKSLKSSTENNHTHSAAVERAAGPRTRLGDQGLRCIPPSAEPCGTMSGKRHSWSRTGNGPRHGRRRRHQQYGHRRSRP